MCYGALNVTLHYPARVLSSRMSTKTAWRNSALSIVQLRFVGKVIGP